MFAVTVWTFGGSFTNTAADRPAAVNAYAGKDGVPVSAVSAVLMAAEGRRVLFSHNGASPLPMASTTKIMTALVAIEQGNLSAETVITEESVGVEGSSLYLTVGERFTREELLYGLLLESGNDAACALAIAVSGSVEAFVDLMNAKASEMGLTSTRFANPHGLSAEGHYTTAAELAAITACALEDKLFRQIVSTVSHKLEGQGHLPRYLVNHNKLLRSYSGLIGVKTGYTMAAGRCLVTAATRGDMTLIAVTLNDRNDWADHTAMLDYGFSAFRMETVYTEGELVAVPVTNGNSPSVLALHQGTVRLCTPTDSTVTRLFDVKAVSAPVYAGQQVATLKVYENGTLVAEIPLTAKAAVAKNKKGLFN